MGIELCVCFSVPKASKDFQLTCLFEVNGVTVRSPIRSFFKLNYAMAESPHLWLLYLPPQCGEFAIKIISDNVKVMKKGFNLVYKQHALWGFGCNPTWYWWFSLGSTWNKWSDDKDDGAGSSGGGYSNEELHTVTWRFMAHSDKYSKMGIFWLLCL